MDPIAKFIELLDRARKTPGIHDATGMTLSTADAEGRPSARVVLVKGVDASGLVFYTNTRSRKYPTTVPRPPHWTGYRVAPTAVEFWWNRPGRLHERELYTRKEPAAPWSMTLLNP